MANLYRVGTDAQVQKGKGSAVATSITDRLSQELVFAFVGPIGSGVSTAGKYLRQQLKQKYEYDVPEVFILSEIIRDTLRRTGKPVPNKDTQPLNEYVDRMQTAGNEIRASTLGENYLIEKTIEGMFRYRREKGGYTDDNCRVLRPIRRAFIIDSLKHSSELELLRSIYGDTLCVVGVFAPDKVRRERLINNGAKKDDVQKVLDRDRNELLTFGQKTEKVFIQADFFVCNDRKEEELQKNLDRYLEIIFNTRIHTPTVGETAMYYADSTSGNSACMSRQVGAAIVSRGGELIAVGRNDVPRAFGGLYREEDQSIWDKDKEKLYDRDNRCFKWASPAGRGVCLNEHRKNQIIKRAMARIEEGQKTVDAITNLIEGQTATRLAPEIEKLKTALAEIGASITADVNTLTEFSRSIHAEMEAILSVAREGKHSLVGATLYTNTYPCHNCARHIVAAGIAGVVYIQPYIKSLALDLHGDAITEDVDDKSRVIFRQFEGVAPRKYRKFFQPERERKDKGGYSPVSPKVATPVLQIPLDSLVIYEDKVIADLGNKEQNRQ